MHPESRAALDKVMPLLKGVQTANDAFIIAFNAGMAEAARLCKLRVHRPAGYNGQWEGYGSTVTQMEGDECAKLIELRLGD